MHLPLARPEDAQGNAHRSNGNSAWQNNSHPASPAADTIRIFGLTRQSTANEAEQRFREEAKPTLFKSADRKLVAEMFFEQVMAELKSRIVITIVVPDVELQGMYEHGLRISGSAAAINILAPDDVARCARCRSAA